MSEKTEKPTDKRVRDARDEGQVARSQEISTLVQLGVVLLWLTAEGANLLGAFSDLITLVIQSINLSLDNAIGQFLEAIFYLCLRFVLGLAAVLFVTLVLANVIQVGFHITPDALIPKGERINPLSHLKQMFSAQKMFTLALMLVKVGILGVTFYYLIKFYAASFSNLSQSPIISGLYVCAQFTQWLWSILLIVTATFSIADYAIQRYQHEKQLMMSIEEIKQEYKSTEGSPEIKKRRREFQSEIQSGSLADKVSQSSLVVRNPTHIAVCIRYEPEETPLPVVLEYGREARAQRIVDIAEALNIPIVEQVPLARALVSSTKPGDFIPEFLFRDVALLLRTIRREMEEDDEDEDQERD